MKDKGAGADHVHVANMQFAASKCKKSGDKQGITQYGSTVYIYRDCYDFCIPPMH